MKLKINEELKALIPPLKEDEYKLLEASILGEGCRDKLITWNDTIVDGHNRFEICQKNGMPFEVEDRDFESFDAVKIWMIDNQKGRRNLTDGWKWELAQTRKEILAIKGKENLKTNVGDGQRLSIIDKGKEHNTQSEIAKELGWSTGKVAMADKVWKEAEPEVKESIKAGETSINQAYQGLKKAHVSNNSGNNEWYTPPKIIQSAKMVMGDIDMDPASSKEANKIVGAKTFFDEEINGLKKDWSGNIWMNPPYSQPLIEEFIKKLILSNYNQAIVLTNNATETKWGHLLLSNCRSVCFPKSRIKFVDINGNLGDSPLQGQMITYFGNNTEEFNNEFLKYGICLNSVEK